MSGCGEVSIYRVHPLGEVLPYPYPAGIVGTLLRDSAINPAPDLNKTLNEGITPVFRLIFIFKCPYEQIKVKFFVPF